MRNPIQLILAITAVAVAFLVGRHIGAPNPRPERTSDPEWSDFQGRSLLSCWHPRNDSAPSRLPSRYELVPYRMVVDGKRVFDTLDGKSKGGDVWEIHLANDRIVIFAVPRPTHETEDQP